MRTINESETELVSGGSHLGGGGEYWTSLDEDAPLVLPTVTIVGSTITFSDVSHVGFFDWNQNGSYEPWADEAMLFASGSEDLGLPTSIDIENDSSLSEEELLQTALTLSTYFTSYPVS